MNLKLMLEKTAGKFGDRTAILLGSRRVTYAELDRDSNRVANALIKLGAGKGDRVAMLINNSPEFVTVYFGISKSGAIAVPLDTRYKIDELASVCNDCRPKVLVAEHSLIEPLLPAMSRLESFEHIIDLDQEHAGQFLSYRHILAANSAQKPGIDLAPDDLTTISYTSAPTTHPRGATFSHRSLITEAIVSGDGFQQTEKDKVMLFALPMYHMFGLAVGLLTAVNKGSTIVMVPGTGLSIGSLMEAIEREKGTILIGVPYIYALMIKMARHEGIKNDLRSLRFCGSGGAPLLVNTIRQFKKLYGFTIIDFWGLTESVAQITSQPIDGSGKLGSCGRVLPGWEIKIVDDSDQELPVNNSGEIIARGHIMSGYYNNPKATAEAVKDGWLHTGDIGKIDEDGYLFITGRKKRMIILKGQNIYPADVEEVLRTHTKIAEARVIGIPDKLRGEIVRVLIRLKKGMAATEQEIRHFCQEHMADYKQPKQIIFTQAIPKTRAATARTGKKVKDYLSKLPSLSDPSYREKAKS